MKLFFIQIIVLLFTINELSAQKMKWGVVSPDDLQLERYAPDTSAHALVLIDKGQIRLDFSDDKPQCTLTRHKRIKILDRSGFEEGNIVIPFNENYQRLYRFKMQTISPSGQQISVSKNDIFTEELENGWQLRKASAPNLEVGSIIELQYTLSSEYITTLHDWYFQTDIPVRRSQLQVYIPDWLNYIFLVEKPHLLKDNKTAVITEDVVNFKNVNVNYRFFSANDLPAIKEEAYVTNIDNHKMKVQFQLFEYAPPSGGYFKYLDDWETTTEELLNDADLGRQFTKKNFSKKLRTYAIQLTAKMTTESEKLTSIYQFLQQKVIWNERYRLYATTKLDDSFEKGKANSGELNMMAIAMLRTVGIDAHPILLSTRSHGHHIVDYPIVNQFNHLIVVAKIEGKDVLLDLTNPFRPPGYIDIEALNGKGFMLKEDHARWIDIRPQLGKNIIAANLSLTKHGQLTGEIKTRCIGYSAINERELLAAEPSGNFWQDRFNEQFTEVQINDIKFEKVDDLDAPLTNSFNVTIADAAQVVGDFIYLNPTLYSNFLENPFQLERREYPVEIPYPFHQQMVLNIDIPTGYKVEELPEPANMILPQKGGQLLFSIEEKGNKIQLTSKIEINQTIYQPEEYAGLKVFFDLIIEKQGEQIVLKKK